MDNLYIDPIFQVQFNAYSISLAGTFALTTPHFRAPIKPKHKIAIGGKIIRKDVYLVLQEIFELLKIELSDDKKKYHCSSDPAVAVAPCQFLISTWDILRKDKRYKSILSEPIIQFFMHVRHAAAHGNRFNILDRYIDKSTNKLIKKAEWRGSIIEPNLHNNTILIPEFMNDADPVFLVSDISVLLKTVS